MEFFKRLFGTLRILLQGGKTDIKILIKVWSAPDRRLHTVMFIMTTWCVVHPRLAYRGGGGDLIRGLTAPLSLCDEIIPNWCQCGSGFARLPAQPGRSVRGLDPWSSSWRRGFTPHREDKGGVVGGGAREAPAVSKNDPIPIWDEQLSHVNFLTVRNFFFILLIRENQYCVPHVNGSEDDFRPCFWCG